MKHVTINKGNTMEFTLTLQELIKLASEFGLPCIVRTKEVTIIGENQLIIFKPKESNKWQMQQRQHHNI